jgi:hypothetical protein
VNQPPTREPRPRLARSCWRFDLAANSAAWVVRVTGAAGQWGPPLAEFERDLVRERASAGHPPPAPVAATAADRR